MNIVVAPVLGEVEFRVVYALWQAMAKFLGPPNRGVLRGAMKQGQLLVARCGALVGGFIHFHLRRDGVVTIYDVAVSPLVRRQGIGKMLVETVAALSPVGKVKLKCTTTNPANLFYKRCGFTLLGTEPSTNTTLNVWERTQDAHANHP